MTIRLRGALGDTVLMAFPDLQASVENGETVLTGEVTDQAALFGVLTEVERLGLELLEVSCDCRTG